MSPLLPGTPEQYPQPSPQQPPLQLWRLSFPQAATTTKAALAEHAALFPSPASPLESQPQEITDASERALCLTAPCPGAAHKRASCRGCERKRAALSAFALSFQPPSPLGPFLVKQSPTPHTTAQGEEDTPPELRGELGNLPVLGLGDITPNGTARQGWVVGSPG